MLGAQCTFETPSSQQVLRLETADEDNRAAHPLGIYFDHTKVQAVYDAPCKSYNIEIYYITSLAPPKIIQCLDVL